MLAENYKMAKGHETKERREEKNKNERRHMENKNKIKRDISSVWEGEEDGERGSKRKCRQRQI